MIRHSKTWLQSVNQDATLLGFSQWNQKAVSLYYIPLNVSRHKSSTMFFIFSECVSPFRNNLIMWYCLLSTGLFASNRYNNLIRSQSSHSYRVWDLLVIREVALYRVENKSLLISKTYSCLKRLARWEYNKLSNNRFNLAVRVCKSSGERGCGMTFRCVSAFLSFGHCRIYGEFFPLWVCRCTHSRSIRTVSSCTLRTAWSCVFSNSWLLPTDLKYMYLSYKNVPPGVKFYMYKTLPEYKKDYAYMNVFVKGNMYYYCPTHEAGITLTLTKPHNTHISNNTNIPISFNKKQARLKEDSSGLVKIEYPLRTINQMEYCFVFKSRRLNAWQDP